MHMVADEMRCGPTPNDMLQPEAAALPAGMLTTPILYSKLMHELVQYESCEVAALP